MRLRVGKRVVHPRKVIPSWAGDLVGGGAGWSVVQSAPWVRDRTASVGPGARVGVDATPVGTSLGMASGCARPREVEAVVDVDGAGLVLCQSQSHGGCDPDGPRPGWAWAWARAGEHHHRQDRRRSRTGPGASRLRSSGDGACGTRPRACTRSRSKCSSIAPRGDIGQQGGQDPSLRCSRSGIPHKPLPL